MGFLTLHRNVRIRIGVMFVQRLMDAMITTFIAIYLAARVGAAVAGVLVLLLAALGMAAMLVGGHLSDSRGRRPVLILGELVACAFFGLMAVAHFVGWGGLAVFFGYALVKFGTSMAMPANDSMIVDVTVTENRKLVYTVSYWATNLALAGGAMLGGFLYTSHFGVLLTIGAAGMGGVLLTTVLFVAETKPDATPAEPPARRSAFGQFVDGYRLVMVDRTFGRLLVAATLGMTLELQMNNYVGIRLAESVPAQNLFPFGTVDGVRMLGLLKAENTILVVILALFINVFLRKVSDRVRLYAGIALFAGGFAVLVVSDTAWVLLLACFVLTIGELMNVPVKQSLLAELAPEQGRPRYMAAYSLNIRVAQALAALFITLGTIVSPWGIAVLYALMGIVIILQYRAILARRGVPATAGEPT